MSYAIARISEPFVKAAFVRWLIDRGAIHIKLSIDGMEAPEGRSHLFTDAEFAFEKNPKSKTTWAGRYIHTSNTVVELVATPGLDVDAFFIDGQRYVAECKGEPTPSGKSAGEDLTRLYCCLGQLIVAAGNLDSLPSGRFLVLPKNDRIKNSLDKLAQNRLIKDAHISIATVDLNGRLKLEADNVALSQPKRVKIPAVI